MTPELAHDYIRRRMDALGHEHNYHIRFRHFVLSPHEVRVIEGGLQLFILTGNVDTVRIESDTGIFDLSETRVNELQYEHQGNLRLTNYSSTTGHVPMIEVIPK